MVSNIPRVEEGGAQLRCLAGRRGSRPGSAAVQRSSLHSLTHRQAHCAGLRASHEGPEQSVAQRDPQEPLSCEGPWESVDSAYMC